MNRVGQTLRAVVAGLCLALAACSASGPSDTSGGSFDGAPIDTVVSDDGALRIEVRTSPSPPVRGTNEVELRVTSVAKSTPVDGLDLSVVPWMPVMAHGASVVPTVHAEGGGRYVLDDVSLFMPGRWELRTTIGGAPQDHAVAKVDVP